MMRAKMTLEMADDGTIVTDINGFVGDLIGMLEVGAADIILRSIKDISLLDQVIQEYAKMVKAVALKEQERRQSEAEMLGKGDGSIYPGRKVTVHIH